MLTASSALHIAARMPRRPKSLLKNLLRIGSPDAEPKRRGDFKFASLSTCASSRRIAGISGFHIRHAAGRGVFQQPPKNSLGPLILYHGCDREIAEAVLSGKETLQPSENDYDWLGPRIYFWVDSPDRALDWAKDRIKRRPQEMGDPSVLGAFAYPGNCLNLTDYGVMDELALAYRATETIFKTAETPLPVNSDRRIWNIPEATA